MFLQASECSLPGFPRVDFSKCVGGPFLTGVLFENGLTGMLEASDYNDLDQMSAFPGPITDVLCDTENEPNVTRLFIQYMKLLNYLRQNKNASDWSKDELNLWHQRVKNFKSSGENVFGKYQALGMKTQKCHLLDHSVDSLGETRGIRFLPGEIFEGSHKIPKNVYRKKLHTMGFRHGQNRETPLTKSG